MKYRIRDKRWKYDLMASEIRYVPIFDCKVQVRGFISLEPDGRLWIGQGYAWDGASGIPDSKITRYASLFHDALYQLIREGLLNRQQHRLSADNIFRQICLEAGMNPTIAWIYWKVLRAFGEKATFPDNKSGGKVIEV